MVSQEIKDAGKSAFLQIIWITLEKTLREHRNEFPMSEIIEATNSVVPPQDIWTTENTTQPTHLWNEVNQAIEETWMALKWLYSIDKLTGGKLYEAARQL